MPKFIIPGLVFLLLLGAGYGLATIQAARAIPWDCSDWQAFAHADRTTAILESLAENRGKTLYCGIDQSDTFSKAETWAAGKDRNERDDTVYFGERGSFRGFIAAQEGWLTEGESGVTGVSIDRIFEFPREERRRKKTVRRKIPADPSRLAASPPGDPLNSANTASRATAEQWARNLFSVSVEPPSAFDWEQWGQIVARDYCRSRGYSHARNVVTIPFDHSIGNSAMWGYTEDRDDRPNYWTFAAYQTRQWTATCEKKVRRTRR